MKKIRAILDDYLDPTEQFAHLLVGVIMVLVLGFLARSNYDAARARVAEARRNHEDPDDDDNPPDKQIISGMWNALGCNVAWGLITGLMYSMSSLHLRSRPIRLRRRILDGTLDDHEAIAIVHEELGPELAVITNKEERDSLYSHIVGRLRHAHVPGPKVQRKDFITGLIIFGLVVVTVLPAYAPFWFLSSRLLALRVANAVLIALLFLIGYGWGRVVRMNSWITGPVIMVIGLVMVVLAEWLGG